MVAAASLVLRFRRARGVERQQLRWLTLAAALAPPVVLGTAAGIISRTVAYGLLTVLLGGAYAGVVLGVSARLRQQVDLDTLTAELLAVVDQTMQPTRAALWLRHSTRS